MKMNKSENYLNVLIISFRLQPKILNTSVEITVFLNSCIGSADALVHILPTKYTPMRGFDQNKQT